MGLPTDAQPLDFTALALPLGEANGGGVNVEYDPEFLELEEEALASPRCNTATPSPKPSNRTGSG